jgi:hypothetical protein
MLTMPLVGRLLRALVSALQSFIGVLRWLALQTYRQRELGVAASPTLTRQLDLHFVTIGAHLALAAALILAGDGISGRDWLLSLPLFALLTVFGLWRGGRWTLGGMVALQLALLLVFLLGPRQPILLAMLAAAAFAQQVALARRALGRATAAGLLLGVFTGGGGLLLGLLTPVIPLLICAILLVAGLVLALRMPGRERPKLPRQADPTKPANPTLVEMPEGYVMYRPSSLGESRGDRSK